MTELTIIPSFRYNRLFLSVPCTSVSKRVLIQNLSYENESDLNENGAERGTYFS